MIILVLFVLGLCSGSFVNALVWRIHEQNKVLNKKTVKSNDLSILNGRSMCPTCRHKLAWYDLIPVLSWIQLKGKCRYCHSVISTQYPLVETSTAVGFVISYGLWPQPFTASHVISLALWLIILTGLVALLIYDLKWMILPNRIIGALVIPASLYALVFVLSSSNPLFSLFSTLGSVGILGGLFWVLFQASHGAWIGGGDVKLGFLLGLIAGSLSHGILILFTASLLGTLVAIPLLIGHKAKTSSRLPFGPFLIVATVVVVLYGGHILNWYNHLILASN